MSLVLKIFTLSVLSYSFSVLAYSEAEKKAFCTDYSRGYANSYETTKAYQYCYSNANALIDKYESNKASIKNKREQDKINIQKEQERIKNLEDNPFTNIQR
jgi:hypothetical protein